MKRPPEQLELAVFRSALGWMAFLASPAGIRQAVIAKGSAREAVAALDEWAVERAQGASRWSELIERLRRYAEGKPVDFRDVTIDLGKLAPFQQQVIRHCRAIPYGQTRSYGELAALAGSPRAARAVGSTMAACRFGVLVPCHRVINANGSPGAFGGPDGAVLKLRLLALEQRGLVDHGPPAARRAKSAPRNSGRTARG